VWQTLISERVLQKAQRDSDKNYLMRQGFEVYRASQTVTLKK
jgi:hypothetical protein